MTGVTVGTPPGVDSSAVMVTVIASGETHAMLDPCDCPQEPGGGFGERATLLSTLSSPEHRLLLDAGGFAGGGLYDAYTEGRAADSIRTLAAIRAMAVMGYDAVAVGDDDLQYGARWLVKTADAAGLPLVSANCFFFGNKRCVPAYRIVVRNGIRFGITALTSTERLVTVDPDVKVVAPLPALRSVWREFLAASDYQILLSHLGEEMLPAIIDSFPGIDVIVNGHRKSSNVPVWTRDSSLVLQFGYQGKKIARAVVKAFPHGERPLRLVAADWLAVPRGMPPDSATQAAIAAAGKASSRTVYDLYIMSHCEYGRAALRELLMFIGRAGDIEWHLWFIGDLRGDTLVSLHGPDELRDEMLWLAVRSLYPERWGAFLSAINAEGASTATVVREQRIDTVALQAWVKKNGRAALADHYRRSLRLGITASPTLYINNTPFDKAITADRLLKRHCASGAAGASWCDSLPECVDDGDCHKQGHVGQCTPSGTCTFLRDQSFTFRVLVADTAMYSPEKAVIATTEELFPAVRIEIIKRGSLEGRRLIKTYAPAALPFYLFGPEVRATRRFSRIESGLVAIKDAFTFKAGIVPVNFYLHRRAEPGRVLALLDPLFPDAVGVAVTLLSDTVVAGRVGIAPVVFGNPAMPTDDTGEKIRREEALRWLVLDSLYRGAFLSYLTGYANNPGSSVAWLDALATGGVEHRAFLQSLRKADGMLAAHWRRIESLGIKDPVTLLVENQEIIPLRNRAELSGVLEYCRRKWKQP